MHIETLPTADAVAQRAADFIAEKIRAGVIVRGQFTLAVSGGTTPWQMLKLLTTEDLPWNAIHLLQVDERVAPDGHSDRNLTHLLEALDGRVPASQIYAMPVTADDLDAAAVTYATGLATLAGSPPVIDLVHLGLGADGHTASLVPGDASLRIENADVTMTGVYQGRRRMTLTYSLLNRSRQILWLAAGASKAPMVARLLAADRTIPAGCVRQDNALVLIDRAAAGDLPTLPRERAIGED